MTFISESVLYNLLIVLGTCLGICLVAAHFYMARNFDYWKKRNIPYLKPKPFVGNLGDLLKLQYGMGHFIEKLYNKFPNEPYFGIFALDTPLLVVKDVSLIKDILVKDANTFVDRNFSPSEDSDPLAAKMLFGAKGDKWKHLRMKLTPTFTSGKMKKMFYLVETHGKKLAENLIEDTKQEEPVLVKEAMTRYTTDVIASCAFGCEANALANVNSLFRKMTKSFVSFEILKYITTTLAFLVPSFIQFSKSKFIEKQDEDFVRRILRDVIAYREKKGEVRNDFVDLLTQIKRNNEKQDESGLALEEDDFVAQAFVFLAAGFETSASTLTFCLYELALHPDVQSKPRQEILSVLTRHEGKYSFDAMMEMAYLDMVISEMVSATVVSQYIFWNMCTAMSYASSTPEIKYKICDAIYDENSENPRFRRLVLLKGAAYQLAAAKLK